MTKTGKYALLGGGALVLFLLLRNSSSLSIPGLVTTTPVSTTAANVTAAGTAAGGILSGLSSLINGTPSASPTVLSSGTSTNVNDNAVLNVNDTSSSPDELDSYLV